MAIIERNSEVFLFKGHIKIVIGIWLYFFYFGVAIILRTSEIEHQLRIFSQLNPRTHTVEELSNRLGIIVQPFLTTLIGATFETIYRGRIHKDPSTCFTNISKLWYPPSTDVEHLGRFNNINESIFYAAGHYAVVANECSIKDNDVISIITCQKKTPNPLKVANMFTNKFRKNNEFIMNVESIDDSQQARDILKTKRNIKIHNVIQKFMEALALRSVAMDEEYKYKFSICVKNLFYAIPDLDGLCYPSIKLDGKSVNFALRPEVADKHYGAMKVTVLRYNAKTDYLECINQSSFIDSITGNITYER